MSDTTVVTSENSAEFYATKLGLEPQKTEETLADNTEKSELSEQIIDESEAVQEEAIQQEKVKPENPKLEKRFSELTKQREDAKREAAAEREARLALEKRIAEIETKTAPKAEELPKVQEGEPRPEQYKDAYEYAKELAKWSANQAIKEEHQRQEKEKVTAGWNERQAAFKATMTDYQDVLDSSSAVVSNEVRDAIVDSDLGPQILYHLAKNPEIAEAWNTKPAHLVLREFGRLEAQLSASKPIVATKPVEKISQAPAPINPIKTSKTMEVPVDANGEFTGSYEQYRAARRAGKIT